MLIDSALWELNDMLDSAGEDEAQYLNAALRAIRTIDSYVDQLETQMDAGACSQPQRITVPRDSQRRPSGGQHA